MVCIEIINIVIYMMDKEYGQKFQSFIINKRNPHIHIKLITDSGLLAEEKEYLLITDKMSIYREKYEKENIKEKIKEKPNNDLKDNVILLSNEDQIEKNIISKFQKAEEIYKKIFLCLSKISKDYSIEKNDFKGIHAVISLNGKGNYYFSIKLAMYLRKRGKTIYIPLNPFPLYEVNCKKNLGDLIFLGQEKLLKKDIEKELFRDGDLYIINPFEHYKDLLDCNYEDLKKCIDELKNSLGFENIILDMSGLYEFTIDLLNIANNVFYIDGGDENIRKSLIKYGKVDGYEDFAKNFEYLKYKQIQAFEENIKNKSIEEICKGDENPDLIKSLLNKIDKECRFDDFI